MNRKICKHCKEYFIPVKNHQKFCFKDDCVRAFNHYTWNKVRKPEIKKALLTIQDLMKPAQDAFNAYIRERDKGKPCISCGKPLRQGNIDAGHYFSSGAHKAVTFNEDNVHAQCSRPCNKDKSGDLLNYQIGIEKRIGGERLILLQTKAHDTADYTREQLREIEKKYKQKLKQLRNESK
jgi:hypothetical protein